MRASAITHNHPTGFIVGGAKRLANKHDQIAYIDLKNLPATVNRNATSGGVVKGSNYGQASYSFTTGFGGFHRDGERPIATIFQPYGAQAYSGGIGGSTPATPNFVTILRDSAASIKAWITIKVNKAKLAQAALDQAAAIGVRHPDEKKLKKVLEKLRRRVDRSSTADQPHSQELARS